MTKYVWENTGNDFLRFIVIERCEYFIASRMSGSEENCGIGSTIYSDLYSFRKVFARHSFIRRYDGDNLDVRSALYTLANQSHPHSTSECAPYHQHHESGRVWTDAIRIQQSVQKRDDITTTTTTTTKRRQKVHVIIQLNYLIIPSSQLPRPLPMMTVRC